MSAVILPHSRLLYRIGRRAAVAVDSGLPLLVLGGDEIGTGGNKQLDRKRVPAVRRIQECSQPAPDDAANINLRRGNRARRDVNLKASHRRTRLGARRRPPFLAKPDAQPLRLRIACCIYLSVMGEHL